MREGCLPIQNRKWTFSKSCIVEYGKFSMRSNAFLLQFFEQNKTMITKEGSLYYFLKNR